MIIGAGRFRCISVAQRGFPGTKNTSRPSIVCHTALNIIEALLNDLITNKGWKFCD